MNSRPAFSTPFVSLVIAFLILGGVGLIAFNTEAGRRSSGLMVRHTLKVQRALNELNGLLQRAESSERGYLLTQDSSYLRNYDNFASRLTVELQNVETLVADNPAQIATIAKVRSLIDERLRLLKRKVELTDAGHVEDAIEIVRTGRGKTVMDEIDKSIADMVAEEDNLYRDRLQKTERDTNELKNAIAALSLAAFAVAAYAIFSSHQQLAALQQSKDALDLTFNALLDESNRREALEAQLRQSQKLEAIGQLTGGIAHDFNNMLAVISASLNILRRKLQRGEGDCESLVDSAQEGATKAAKLVKRLLAFARLQPLEPRSVDVNKLLSEMSEMLKRTLGAGVQLQTSLATDAWNTIVDPIELESLILNLSVNARDAMPAGGKLFLETANVVLDENYAANNPDCTPGQYLLITVSDTGSGMPRDIIAKAFDPFFTTKPVGKGTGLGLSQAHGFVKQTGGHIKIYSEIGRGTSIKVYLPRQRSEVLQHVKEGASAAYPGRPDELILVVDDDLATLRLTAQNVRELGYTALEAHGGKAAIDILRTRADIQLLLTDVVMPDIDGPRLAREAVFRRHSLRVLFSTGYTRNAAVYNGALQTNVDVLTKPFTLEELGQKIRMLLDG